MEKTRFDLTPDDSHHTAMTCNHQFGDDGQSPVCLECGTDRQVAEHCGRTLHKVAKHRIHLLGRWP